MKIVRYLASFFILFCLLPVTTLHAQKLYPAPPANIKVFAPNKPHNVKEITASKSTCDSPSTYSFMVSWTPLFRTWGLPPGNAPYIWKHYAVSTKSKCALSIVHCGDTACTIKASHCPPTSHYALVRIQTYFDETHTGRGGWSQISGIPRPAFQWHYNERSWECLGDKGEAGN